MPLYEIGSDQFNEVGSTTFQAAQVREREDLQRLLREQIDILVPDSMVLDEEFSDWEDSRRRIDLLVLDREAKLVVVELKRDAEGAHMELQALRYAAMVSAMTFVQAVTAHSRFLRKLGSDEDPRERILQFLGWPEPDADAFAQDTRVVLASADFGKELTTAVLWLNEQGLDIRCVRLVPYAYGDRTLVHLEQLIPLPEAEEYQVRVREKASQERAARQEHGPRAERNIRFWASLLERANRVLPLHRNISPSRENWLSASMGGVLYLYVTAHGKGRVELCLETGTKEENEALFDHLHANRSQIETSFGGEFKWRRLDGKKSSRIAARVEGGSVLDEGTWPSLQDAMVDAMRRMEAAVRPILDTYDAGGRR